ncbi:FAD-binding domain-containing protein [Testicularia cyperi]|uniref:FAD-binding domain-containing protein n=1 Tax=Testicularia cyperi TaxID=1882483 RepID=A0A317XI80_9BASI|nr:FAD-binding domain-containing protein [Testicularia cyperi]
MKAVRRKSALAIGLAASTLAAAATLPWTQPHTRALQTDTLEQCLVDARLHVVSQQLSDAAIYFQASASDNLMFHYNPHAVVFANNADQVQQAVKCAAAQNPPVAIAARSGGHSFASFGSGGMDGSLIIDLANMSSIDSQPQLNIVDVQPGARLGDIIKQLWHQHGARRAMNTGTCPTVGAGGLSLCGGFGPMSRHWGLTTDNILEADLVLANGSQITVTETQNTDVMWGLRGAGAFFGIVTRFRYRTHDAGDPIIFFDMQWTPSITSPDVGVRLLSAIQAFGIAKDLDTKLGFHVQLKRPTVTDPQPAEGRHVAIHMRGAYLGSLNGWAELRQRFAHHLNKHKAPAPDLDVEQQATYLATMEAWDDFGEPGDKLNTEKEHKLHNNYVVKSSLTLDSRKGFKKHAWKDLLQFLWDTGFEPGRNEVLADGTSVMWAWNIYLELFGGGMPAYRHPDKVKAGSFANRDGLWLIQIAVGTTSTMTLAPSGHAYAFATDRQVNKAIKDSGLQRAGYSCYVDPDLPEHEWKQLYYGPSLHRLEDLKMDLDPRNIFRNPQSLGSKKQILEQRNLKSQ